MCVCVWRLLPIVQFCRVSQDSCWNATLQIWMWERFLSDIHSFDVMRVFILERNLLNMERPLSNSVLRIHQMIHNRKKCSELNFVTFHNRIHIREFIWEITKSPVPFKTQLEVLMWGSFFGFLLFCWYVSPQIRISITFYCIRTLRMNESDSNHLSFFFGCFGYSSFLPFHLSFRIILFVSVKDLERKCIKPMNSQSLAFISMLPSNKWR